MSCLPTKIQACQPQQSGAIVWDCKWGNFWLNNNIYETGENGAKTSSISHTNGPMAIAWVSRWDLESWQAYQDIRALSRYSRSNMCGLSQIAFFLGLRNTHHRPYCEILNFAMMTVVSFFTVALVTHTQLTLRVMARQHRLWVLSADIWAHLHWLLEPYLT